MSGLEHGEVQAWLDESFFTPRALTADDPSTRTLREHLSACPTCTAYAASLRVAAQKLDLVRGPSPQVRQRVLATVHAVGRSRAPRERAAPGLLGRLGLRPALAWQVVAAVLVIGVVSAAIGAWWGLANRSEAATTRQLAQAVEMMATLATDPAANQMVLRDATGRSAGVAVMSATTHQIAVVTAALPPPSADGGYDCYLERGGDRTWIGPMNYAEGLSFWAGTMDEGMQPGAGDELVIAVDRSSPEMLSAGF